MQFEGRRRTGTSPNLTPLIDVVFLLLVFFMLTSHFVKEETIVVDLPQADSGEPSDKESLEVVIDAQGRILLHDHFVEPESLEETLRRELAAQEEKLVRIRGDKAAVLGTAIEVLDAARKAGATGADIVTEEK